MEIFKFKDENKELSLAIINKQLTYLKNENNQKTTNLTKSEITLINQVLINLIPSTNLQEELNLKYNNQIIKHLYDKKTNLHFFLDTTSKKITKPCYLLSYLYNNQLEYVSSAKDENLKLQIKRIVKLGKKVLIVFVNITFLLTSYQIANNITWLKDDNQYIQTNQTITKQLTLNEIYNALNQNKNLTNEEKKFFLQNSKFFQDNLPYWDYNQTLLKLKTLKINYSKEPDETISGVYTYQGDLANTIIFYKAKNFQDVNPSIATHEFIHLFTDFTNNQFNYLYEGLTALANNEYFSLNSNYDNTYYNLTKYIYLLAEIIDPDVLREYLAKNDLKIIVDALTKIIPNENTAYSLLKDIDFQGRLNILPIEEQLAFKEESKLRDKMIISTYTKYYQAKYESDITDNYNALYWLNKPLCFTKLSAELGFKDETMLAADEYTKVLNYKKIFNTNTNSNLTFLIPREVNNNQVTNYLEYEIPYNKESRKI